MTGLNFSISIKIHTLMNKTFFYWNLIKNEKKLLCGKNILYKKFLTISIIDK